MKRFTKAITFDLILAAVAYLWQVKGIDGARVFLQCILWVVAAAHWIVILSGNAAGLVTVRGFYRLYDVVTTMSLTFALIWLGLPYLAAVLFIGWVVSTTLRNEKPKSPDALPDVKREPPPMPQCKPAREAGRP